MKFFDLREQNKTCEKEIYEAIKRIQDHGQFIMGPEVKVFESEISAYIGTKHAIGVSSGTDALLVALKAYSEIGMVDKVYTTPFTFGATVTAILNARLMPRFVDVGEDFNMDFNQIPELGVYDILLPVHCFGNPCDMEKLSLCHRPIIEDAAQAIGASVNNKNIGTFGMAGCFSFFPSKNLGGWGDGGLIVTDNDELADAAKKIRVQGSSVKYFFDYVGGNHRLDTLQAAILSIKLKHLDHWTRKRQFNAYKYHQLFTQADIPGVILPTQKPGVRHVWNQYVIRVQRREALWQHLAAAGIMTEVYWPAPMHTQEAFKFLGYKRGDFPNAEKACDEVIALPIYPEFREQEKVVDMISRFYKPTRVKVWLNDDGPTEITKGE